jgi:CubicO group peptidase (beta-lactamase class C family)
VETLTATLAIAAWIRKLDSPARVTNTALILPVGTMPVYSNLGFDVLGQSLAYIHKKPYENVIHDLLLEPLNLTHTGVNMTTLPLIQREDNLAFPYLEGNVAFVMPTRQRRRLKADQGNANIASE